MASVVLSLVQGCGNKGDLYIPEPDRQPVPPVPKIQQQTSDSDKQKN